MVSPITAQNSNYLAKSRNLLANQDLTSTEDQPFLGLKAQPEPRLNDGFTLADAKQGMQILREMGREVRRELNPKNHLSQDLHAKLVQAKPQAPASADGAPGEGQVKPAKKKPASDQQGLDDIKRKYQTQEDELAQWEPKLFGEIPVDHEKINITRTEGRMLDRLTKTHGLAGLYAFKSIREKALAGANQHYPPSKAPLPTHVAQDIKKLPVADQAGATNAWPGNDGHNDAFRHAYWSALLTKQFGSEWAKQFTTAHEGVPNNGAVREAMDLYNNEVGRKIAQANPNATPEQLAVLIEQAIKDGKMVVVNDKGQLARSNQVAVGQHGMANPQVSTAQASPKPSGEASAN